jgi:acetyl esterase/lipase
VEKPPGKAPLRYRDVVFAKVSVQRDVPYGSLSEQTLDSYTPVGDRKRDRPALVWIHGGGFRSGSKSQANAAEAARAFAQRGYVAVSIDYRLLAAQGASQGEAALAARADAQTAVAWVRSHASKLGIDPSRIAVGGTSAGAATSLLVGTDGTSRVRAAISISGYLPGGSYTRKDAPTLFFHGTEDPTVPYAGGKATANAMAAAGVPVVFETLAGAGHVPWAQYRNRFIVHSAYFLYDHLV